MKTWRFGLLFLFWASMSVLLAFAIPGSAQAWVNPSFETGTLTGWTTNTNSGGGLACGSPTASIVSVAGGAAPDSVGPLTPAGLPLVGPGNGNYAVQIFSSRGDSNFEDWAQVWQSDTVPSGGTSCCLSFDVAAILEDHHYTDQQDTFGDAYVEADVVIGGGTGGAGGVTVASFRYGWGYDVGTGLLQPTGQNGPGTYPACDITQTPYPNWGFIPWTPQTVNLCAYAGQQATLLVTAFDCDGDGHYSLGYLDNVRWETCVPPQFTLVKSVSPPGNVNPGDTLTYSLAYSNPSSVPIDGVQVCDTIPDDVKLLSDTVGANPPLGAVTWTGTSAGDVLCWDLGYVGAHVSGTLSFAVSVKKACNTIINQAEETDAQTSGLVSNAVTNEVASCTPTKTPKTTPTWTSTPSPSLSPTVTNTWTRTYTRTPTSTATDTPTWTETSTFTKTPTRTPTASPTPSPTETGTPTSTVTWSPSPTPTPTLVWTGTETPTDSPTVTATNSPAWTTTFTMTDTQTPTSSPTKTVTPTWTATPTNSPTPTPTSFPADTATPTLSLSATWTDTFTATPTPTNPPTAVPTMTATPTMTWTETGTPTPTASATSILTLTPSPTVTETLPSPGVYTLTVGIYNEAGELIRQVQAGTSSSAALRLVLSTSAIDSLDQPLTIDDGAAIPAVWDGTGKDGQPVSNGQYYVKVDSADAVGNVNSVTQPILVQRSLSQITLNVYDEAGEIVRHLLSDTRDASDGVVHSAALSNSVLTLSPRGGTSSAITFFGDGRVLGLWDGTTDQGVFVNGGTYYFSLHEWDGKGNETNLTLPVAVLGFGTPAGLEVRALPNVIRGTGGLVFESFPPQPLSLKATLYDLAGEKVAVENGAPGSGQVGWDASRVASGIYLAAVECRDEEGRIARRQILKIAVIR